MCIMNTKSTYFSMWCKVLWSYGFCLILNAIGIHEIKFGWIDHCISFEIQGSSEIGKCKAIEFLCPSTYRYHKKYAYWWINQRRIDSWEVTCKTIVLLSNFKPMYVYGYKKINTMVSRNLFTITSREEKKL